VLPWRALGRLSLLRVMIMPLASVIPLRPLMLASQKPDEDLESTWLYLVCAAFLVILGGAFSGLTIA
jgi:nitrate/nitrite transporter NarK